MGFFWEIYVFHEVSCIGLFRTKRANLHFKNLSCRKDSSQKLTKFSKGNNVQDAAVFNIDDFLWRNRYVSSTQQNRLFVTKTAYLHLETSTLQEVFLSKTNLILTEKQCARCSCILHWRFSLRDTCVSSP
jgi:hypothetical protein